MSPTRRDDGLVATSRFLSLVLRHQPQVIGLVLDAQGWAGIDTLVQLANAHGVALTRAQVDEVVATSDKQRFAISDDGRRIRANQGHSVAVDLALPVVEPPAVLFHGTVARFLPSIREHGLLRGQRQHVHLSPDEATARTVGARRGVPCVLEVAADAMYREGFRFHRADNGVWLTDHVPPRFLRFP